MRENASPRQFVTTDFSGAMHSDVNEEAVARSLDIPAANIYHWGPQDGYNGADQAAQADFIRSLKDGQKIRLRGKGVPHLRRTGQRGDLHVMVDVVVPTKLSKKARDLLAAYADEAGETVGHGGGGLLEKLGLG